MRICRVCDRVMAGAFHECSPPSEQDVRAALVEVMSEELGPHVTSRLADAILAEFVVTPRRR